MQPTFTGSLFQAQPLILWQSTRQAEQVQHSVRYTAGPANLVKAHAKIAEAILKGLSYNCPTMARRYSDYRNVRKPRAWSKRRSPFTPPKSRNSPTVLAFL